jgi:nickel-dependent lactate racemase
MLLFARGSPTTALSTSDLKAGVLSVLEALGPRSRVLVLPPDITRFHSRAGELTRYVWERLGDRVAAILPALGTHAAMRGDEIQRMFVNIPPSLFRVHDFRHDAITVGTIADDTVAGFTGNRCRFEWPAQVNRLLVDGGFDCILSIGQVVPHEVAGMANHAKNIFVGTGGAAGINGSHFIGALCGMERIMGRADTPVRRLFDHAGRAFIPNAPITYLLTVIDTDGTTVRGLFAGPDRECFERAAALSQSVNITLLDRPVRKAVVYLDPQEYRSAWLGNKAIYRTRMALADAGELIVLAPGVCRFGEDPAIDRFIRAYGYCGTPAVMRAVAADPALADNLGAAAHLIHGSGEGRFTVTYCPGALTKAEIEGVHFHYGELDTMAGRYDPARLSAGWNVMPDGEEIFYIPNPALGLWAERSKFR